MTMHTSGPWRVEGSTVVEDCMYLIVSAEASDVDGKRRVALVGAWDVVGEYNARVIAAAPKTLAACQAVVDRWEGGDLAEAVRMCGAAVAEAMQTAGRQDRGPAPVRGVRLPCYGIRIQLARENTHNEPGCGTITSDLKEPAQDARGIRFNAAIDGLESLILAHACAGMDVESPAYVEAIETAVEAISNNL